MRVAALFDRLHSVGVLHGDAEERHVIGPKDDLSRWRLIDFDQATTVDEIPKGTELGRIADEHYSVQMRFRLSPDVWFLEPRRIFESSFTSASPVIIAKTLGGHSISQQVPDREVRTRGASRSAMASEKSGKTMPQLDPGADDGKAARWRFRRGLSKWFHTKPSKFEWTI